MMKAIAGGTLPTMCPSAGSRESPGRKTPTSRFLRLYFPQNRFRLEPKGNACVSIASGTYRLGWIARTFFKKKVRRGTASVRKHMKEESENLKQIVERNT